MNYKIITEQIAADNDTTAKEVEEEMKKALKAAGLDIEPDMFISLISSGIKKSLYLRQLG